MDATNPFLLAGSGALMGMAVSFAVSAFIDRRRERAIDDSFESLFETDPWHTLPDGRIELGATGYAIKHLPGSDAAFQLFSPEGVRVATGQPGSLDQLKGYAETLADERQQFEPLDDVAGLAARVDALVARVRKP